MLLALTVAKIAQLKIYQANSRKIVCYVELQIFTLAEEVMFLPWLVCRVCSITEKATGEFLQISV